MIFGAKSSQNLFDKAMFRIFGDIPNCLNQKDDNLIGLFTLADHNKTLETVLQRVEDIKRTRHSLRMGTGRISSISEAKRQYQ